MKGTLRIESPSPPIKTIVKSDLIQFVKAIDPNLL